MIQNADSGRSEPHPTDTERRQHWQGLPLAKLVEGALAMFWTLFRISDGNRSQSLQ